MGIVAAAASLEAQRWSVHVQWCRRTGVGHAVAEAQGCGGTVLSLCAVEAWTELERLRRLGSEGEG